jgi:MFS family permease
MSAASRDKLILLFGLVTYGMGQSLLYVIFGPLARDIGLSEAQFGILIAASNVALVFSAPRWGRASQSMGRKPVFIIGLIGYAVGYAVLAIGLQIGLWGLLAPLPLFFLLLGARLIYGIVCGGIQPAATAYIADTTDESSRAQGMALLAASGGIGTIIGPAFGGFLAGFGAVVPMYSAAVLAVGAAIWSYVSLREPERHASSSQAIKVRFNDPRVFPYLFGWFVIFMVFTAVQVVTPFYIEDHFGVTGRDAVIRVAMIALLSMALVTLVVQIVIMQVWKLSPRVLLRVAFFIIGIDLFVLAYADSLLMLYLAYAGMGLSFAMAMPGLNAAASISVESAEQGAVAGLLGAAPTLGMVFGPILGGAVYTLAPNWPMIGGAIACVALGVYFQFVQVPEPRVMPVTGT